MKIHPLNDLVLVKLDPFKEKSKGGLILTADSQENNVRTAKVLRVGPGRRLENHRIPVGVEPGEKVAFLRWHLEHQSGKQITGFLSDLGDDLALIRGPDILFAFPDGVEIDVS